MLKPIGLVEIGSNSELENRALNSKMCKTISAIVFRPFFYKLKIDFEVWFQLLFQISLMSNLMPVKRLSVSRSVDSWHFSYERFFLLIDHVFDLFQIDFSFDHNSRIYWQKIGQKISQNLSCSQLAFLLHPKCKNWLFFFHFFFD